MEGAIWMGKRMQREIVSLTGALDYVLNEADRKFADGDGGN